MYCKPSAKMPKTNNFNILTPDFIINDRKVDVFINGKIVKKKKSKEHTPKTLFELKVLHVD